LSRRPDPFTLPQNLPVPKDDGACDHLVGMRIPGGVSLYSTLNRMVDAGEISNCGRKVVFFFYPMTGKPGVPLPKGWDSIPGARGCTPESCSYRDHYSEFVELGIEVYGISTQSTEDQREFSQRANIPYELLSDSKLELARILKLPTFQVAEVPTPFIKRLTVIFDETGKIGKVFYPVFPPDKNAIDVLDYIRNSRRM
jgi:peroxiredoxin